MSKSQGAPKRTKFLRNLGFVLTGALLLVVAISICFRFSDTGTMTLNEWGDFLAGVTAPLALLWLVIGYFQHGEELRLNTSALKTQQEELRRQVEETARLVDATQEEVRYLQERERREAKPDLIPSGGGGSSRGSMYVELQNRGKEIRAIRMQHEGSYRLTFSRKEVWESGSTATLTLHHDRNHLTAFPIRFRIICADLIGYSHTMEFEWNDGIDIRILTHTS